MKRYVGIDNGLDGAVASLNEDGTIAFYCRMPTISLGKGRVVDVLELEALIGGAYVILVEEASKHSPGKMALCSTWFTFGHILSLLKIKRCRWDTIGSQKWQKTFWSKPKMPKGQKFDTKAAALVAATKLWPDEKFLATQQSTVPHDGIVDALLIAEYARRNNL